MDILKQDLIEIVHKMLTFVKESISTKLLITLLVMAGSAYVAFQQGGWPAVIAAIASIAGIGGTFIVTKQKQNALIIQNGLNKPKPVAKPTVANVYTPVSTAFENIELTASVDWSGFWSQVEAEESRLIKELPKGEKGKEFARYEAIMNVGRRFPVNNTEDITSYAAAIYDSTLKWFKEVAGFDYWEAQVNGIPAALAGRCGCSNLDAWITDNMHVKPAVQAVKYGISRCNELAELQSGWQASFPDWARTLFYVYQNVARH